MEINAPSLSEWLTTDHVRRVVAKHFKNFLMTFVDEKTTDSVYGPAIKTLGAGPFSFWLRIFLCSE